MWIKTPPKTSGPYGWRGPRQNAAIVHVRIGVWAEVLTA
jgi:hypothetical protein